MRNITERNRVFRPRRKKKKGKKKIKEKKLWRSFSYVYFFLKRKFYKKKKKAYEPFAILLSFYIPYDETKLYLEENIDALEG